MAVDRYFHKCILPMCGVRHVTESSKAHRCIVAGRGATTIRLPGNMAYTTDNANHKALAQAISASSTATARCESKNDAPGAQPHGG
jgi:hypothetical protein